MAHISQLPRDVLFHIFSYYLENEKKEYLLKVISKVCRTWDSVVKYDFVWDPFDGTLPFSIFLRFCKEGVLRNSRYVKFSATPKTVRNTVLSKIYENLPCARRIDFSNVRVLQERFFTILEDKCFDLCEIVFSDENSKDRSNITFQMFSNFFVLRGPKITHLDFSYSYVVGLQKMFILIAQTCPNLEELLAQNIVITSSELKFPIERMQNGCPKLKVLRLGFPIRYGMKSRKSSPGFPLLEVFTHSALREVDFTDQCFLRLLFLSDKLKELDFTGCGLLTVNAVCSLPANDLERLYISTSKINFSGNMRELLIKWSHSLIELDISKNDLEDINDILWSVIPYNGMPQLERLTISQTQLQVSTLRLIIQNCTKLSYLEITGCERIGRQLMHAYHGRHALEDLLSKLNRIEYDY